MAIFDVPIWIDWGNRRWWWRWSVYVVVAFGVVTFAKNFRATNSVGTQWNVVITSLSQHIRYNEPQLAGNFNIGTVSITFKHFTYQRAWSLLSLHDQSHNRSSDAPAEKPQNTRYLLWWCFWISWYALDARHYRRKIHCLPTEAKRTLPVVFPMLPCMQFPFPNLNIPQTHLRQPSIWLKPLPLRERDEHRNETASSDEQPWISQSRSKHVSSQLGPSSLPSCSPSTWHLHQQSPMPSWQHQIVLRVEALQGRLG